MTARTLTGLALALLGGATTPPASAREAMSPAALAEATTPVHRLDTVEWWGPRHQERLAERDAAVAGEKEIHLVFIGDSITHGWENAGKEIWSERFAPRGAMNLGFGGDRTEHVLWRLGLGEAGEENNEVGGLTPKLFVVMIGTNNAGHRQGAPEATAAGVEAIVDLLQSLAPEAKVLLLAIFPRGADDQDPLRKINAEVNERLAELGDRQGVEFLDINHVFLDDDGVLPKEIMADLLHPGEEGYRRWADAIEPHVARLMGETP